MALQHTEIAVIGGGMVGSSVALGLAQQGLTVTMIEQVVPPPFDTLSPPEVRVSALGKASVKLLGNLGVWDTVQAMRAHPYRRLEIWERESARITFNARELKLPQLGYMVENNVLQLALWKALEIHPNIILCAPAILTAMERTKQGYHLTLNNGDELRAILVVGGDGANSQVRQMANIGIHVWQYRQACMLITVRCETDPGYSIWQKFTPNGPRAFLPLFDHWASLVWYDMPSRIRQLQELSMPNLKDEILRNFPGQLGKVIPSATRTFPLTRRQAFQYAQDGLVLVGDAAHTIHPLAGQGVNLGYRDASELLDVIRSARIRGEPWVRQNVLSRYQRRRMIDNFIMQSGIDLLYAGFSNNLDPVRFLRNIGLILSEHSGVLKRKVMKYVLGL